MKVADVTLRELVMASMRTVLTCWGLLGLACPLGLAADLNGGSLVAVEERARG